MSKSLPVIVTLAAVVMAGYFVIQQKNKLYNSQTENKKQNITIADIGSFGYQKRCSRPPLFLKQMKISQPTIIDLSQKQYKGIALHYGKNFSKTLHPEIWEQYGHFGTYSVDKDGNIYLAPTPYISIKPTTFNLQKNIYKLDSKSAKISIFMHFDDIHPSSNNPYGLIAVEYDCDDNTLWASAIDESDYQNQKGVVYHIDIYSKEIIQKIKDIDILTMRLLLSDKGKFLLAGSARDNGLYAYPIIKDRIKNSPIKILELPYANEHIRKIKIIGKNSLELQAIPFSYTLVAQSAKKDRSVYKAIWNTKEKKWDIATL